MHNWKCKYVESSRPAHLVSLCINISKDVVAQQMVWLRPTNEALDSCTLRNYKFWLEYGPYAEDGGGNVRHCKNFAQFLVVECWSKIGMCFCVRLRDLATGRGIVAKQVESEWVCLEWALTLLHLYTFVYMQGWWHPCHHCLGGHGKNTWAVVSIIKRLDILPRSTNKQLSCFKLARSSERWGITPASVINHKLERYSMFTACPEASNRIQISSLYYSRLNDRSTNRLLRY